MKTIIHINQHNIKHNNKVEPQDRIPVITCKTYKDNVYTNTLKIVDSTGNIVAKVIYRPDNPLSCGAKVWIEADSSNVVIGELNENNIGRF